MDDLRKFSLRNNAVLLLFIIFVVGILLIFLVNGWILRQLNQKDTGIPAQEIKAGFRPAGKPKALEKKIPQDFPAPKAQEPAKPSDKKNHEIPLDSEILLQ